MREDLLISEFRKPRQMLGDQEYDGHLSIHDDKMAEDLGFSGAPIEGPTHFSQLCPCFIKSLEMIGLQKAALVSTIKTRWWKDKKSRQ